MTFLQNRPCWAFVARLMALACFVVFSARADTLISDFVENDCVQGRYGSWEDVEPSRRDAKWTITTRGFGGAFKNFSPPRLDVSADTMIELTVNIEAPTPSTQPVVAGPLVVLEDAAENQSVWAWYGLGVGRHVLVGDLSLPSFSKKPGSVRGLNFAKLAAFHIQVDPGKSTAAYTITFEKLRLISAGPTSAR